MAILPYGLLNANLAYTKITLENSDYRIRVPDIKRVGEKAIVAATRPLTRDEKWTRIEGLKIMGRDVKQL